MQNTHWCGCAHKKADMVEDFESSIKQWMCDAWSQKESVNVCETIMCKTVIVILLIFPDWSAFNIWRDRFNNICVCVAWVPQSECQPSVSANHWAKQPLWQCGHYLLCVQVSISSTGLQMPLYPFPRGKICVQISRINFLRITPPCLKCCKHICVTRLYLPDPNKKYT